MSRRNAARRLTVTEGKKRMQATPAVFLDRDGVIIEEERWLARVEQVRLIDGCAAAIRRLNQAGVPVVVVTNQSGVARGLFPEERIAEVHARLDRLLADKGAVVRRYYYCPHHPSEGIEKYRIDCTCRKPRPGMLRAAAADLGLDLRQSWLIGDTLSDLEAGARADCRTILVLTGHGTRSAASLSPGRFRCAGVVTALPEAVELWALPDARRPARQAWDRAPR